MAAYATFMVGFNVMLGTDDVAIAKKIARMVSGTHGGFSTVRAAGMPQSQRGGTTVSMDVWSSEAPLHRIYRVIKAEAERLGVPVTGSVICGTVPLDALVDCAEYSLRLQEFDRSMIVENQLFGLPADGADVDLLDLPLRDFVARLYSEDAKYGGGSVAALAGSLAAGLVVMVGRTILRGEGRRRAAVG